MKTVEIEVRNSHILNNYFTWHFCECKNQRPAKISILYCLCATTRNIIKAERNNTDISSTAMNI